MATRVNDGGSALYFYGVSRGSGARVPALRGIDAVGAVENCDCSGLTCWFSRVDRSEWGDRLEQNMENLEWLANASVHHQRVVASIAEQTDILPARFGTVFLSTKSLEAHVAERKSALTSALNRIEGASEWGVKVFAEAGAAPQATPASSGTDYLRQKREQLRQRETPGAPTELGKMNQDLGKAAVASAATRGKSPQPGLMWQASFLVKRAREKAFHDVLRKYAAKLVQARIETSGPWPPYSFAATEEAKPVAGARKKVRSAKQARKTASKPKRGRRS